MTTIAWDGKTLAADGRMTSGYIIDTDATQKLHRLHRVKYFYDELYYLGLCGLVRHTEEILGRVSTDNFHDLEVGSSLEVGGIIIGRDYAYYLTSGDRYLSRVDRGTPMVAGSGGEYAASAMALGLDAKQAIRHAMKFDSCTGGKIRSVRIK